jgi:hypothetical protein
MHAHRLFNIYQNNIENTFFSPSSLPTHIHPNITLNKTPVQIKTFLKYVKAKLKGYID